MRGTDLEEAKVGDTDIYRRVDPQPLSRTWIVLLSASPAVAGGALGSVAQDREGLGKINPVDVLVSPLSSKASGRESGDCRG